MNIFTLKFINFKHQHIFTVISKNGDNDNISTRFRKRSTNIFLEMTTDPSHPNLLKKFSHIDYRNCQCDNVISHLFWKLHEHIERSGKLIMF